MGLLNSLDTSTWVGSVVLLISLVCYDTIRDAGCRARILTELAVLYRSLDLQSLLPPARQIPRPIAMEGVEIPVHACGLECTVPVHCARAA